MISLSTVEAKLPPGFRFHPKDEELVCNYLMNWVAGCTQHTTFLILVDLNRCEPWNIPDTACVGGKEWYFYSQRDRKYATGLRTNRATVSGYWKATGKDRPVIRKGTQVGMRKTLVFYQGRAPKGRKTEWVMHEFRIEGAIPRSSKKQEQPHSVKEQDWVLCRMFYKNRTETPLNTNSIIDNNASAHSQLIPNPSPLMEPCNNNTIFTPYPQQVPCFSNANPNFSIVTNIPSLGQTVPYPGICNPPSLDCDAKVIKDVLNYLANTSSVSDNNPSFGEGSSESYLSDEAGLMSSLWNQY